MTAFPFLVIIISEYLDYSVYLYMYNHVLPQFSIKKISFSECFVCNRDNVVCYQSNFDSV